MHVKDIRVGGFYVNAKGYLSLVREVVDETFDGDILYRDYDLDDGTPGFVTPRRCQKTTLANWAAREATAEEVAKLQTHLADAIAEERVETRIFEALRGATDAEVLNEVQRRGLVGAMSDDELLAEVRRGTGTSNQPNQTPKWHSFLPQNHINPWFDPFQFLRMGMALERFRILYQRGYFADFPEEAQDFVEVVNESLELLESVELGALARYPVIPSDIFSAIGDVMEYLYDLDEDKAAIAPVSNELRPEYLRPDEFEHALSETFPVELVVSPEEYTELIGEDPQPASE